MCTEYVGPVTPDEEQNEDTIMSRFTTLNAAYLTTVSQDYQ